MMLDELAAQGVDTGTVPTCTHAQSVAKSICFSQKCTQKKLAVEIVVNHLDDDPELGSEIIAWLHRYKLVSVKLLLQTYIYTHNKAMFTVCGTGCLEPDTKVYLDLPEIEVAKGEEYEGPVLDVEINVNPLKRAAEPRTNSLKKREIQSVGLSINPVAGILTSYSSAIEASKKIVQIGGDHDQTAETICEQCYKSSPYNRFYGSVAVCLLKSNETIWTASFSNSLGTLFTSTSDKLDTDQLQTIGTFYGHIMSSVDWTPFLEMTSLAPTVSTPSNRILLMAMLTELKQEVGEEEVQTRIRAAQVKSLMEGQLAAKFWKAVNLKKVD